MGKAVPKVHHGLVIVTFKIYTRYGMKAYQVHPTVYALEKLHNGLDMRRSVVYATKNDILE